MIAATRMVNGILESHWRLMAHTLQVTRGKFGKSKRAENMRNRLWRRYFEGIIGLVSKSELCIFGFLVKEWCMPSFFLWGGFHFFRHLPHKWEFFGVVTSSDIPKRRMIQQMKERIGQAQHLNWTSPQPSGYPHSRFGAGVKPLAALVIELTFGFSN